MQVVGWIGTILVVIAYYPQIRHLWAEQCAWGISLSTWVIWLFASLFLSIHCIARGELLLTLVQFINIMAIGTTILLVRRSRKLCPYHLGVGDRHR